MLEGHDKTEAAFRHWLRRLVTDIAELKAFDAGEIDAVMDRDSGSAVLLPEAQTALQDSNRIALSALDALPGEVCVLDADGVVAHDQQGVARFRRRPWARGPRCANGREHPGGLRRRTRQRTRTCDIGG